MGDDGSKVKRPGRNSREVSRDVRTKLQNINKNSSLFKFKEKLKISTMISGNKSSNNKSLLAPASTSVGSKAKEKQSTVALGGKSETIQKPAINDVTNKLSQLSSSNVMSANKINNNNTSNKDKNPENPKNFNENLLSLKQPSWNKSSGKYKNEPNRGKLTKEKYTAEELRNKIADLNKQTKTLRAEDPAVEKLIANVNESLQAIEALEKIYTSIYQETKTRTKQLEDEFEHLKTLRDRHTKDLYSQIALQVRSEIDGRNELDEILRDSNFKNLVTQQNQKQNVNQPSFFVSMLKSIIGL